MPLPNPPSILRILLLSFLAFGLGMGTVFPFYASFFVEWKPGLFHWFSLGCLLAGAIVGVINYLLLKVILLRRLERLAQVSLAISDKDLSRTCDVVSDDMVGEIVSSFNAMVVTLREIFAEVDRQVDGINSATLAARLVTMRASDGATTQQQQIREIAAAMRALDDSVREEADNVVEVAEATRSADEQGDSAQVVVKQAMQAVDGLAAMVEEATAVIRRLDAESGNISNVVAVISAISEQTNLLALNAAIEAARAGEQGRGFAVVADEVRTLATRTQHSTTEIGAIVADLQAGSREAVQTMERGQQQARQGVDLTARAHAALLSIAGAVKTIREMTTRIERATRDQGAGVQTVNQHLVEVDGVAAMVVEAGAATTSATGDLEARLSRLRALLAQYDHQAQR